MTARLKIDKTGGVTMRVTLEINFALWGMIFCAAVQAAQHFGVY